MAQFPKLKTNAVAQYPASRTTVFRNVRLRFVDGKEQRIRGGGAPLKRWEIRLAQLDEGEMAAIEQFFVEKQGQYGTFAFTDPWDGREYPNCSLASDELLLETTGEARGATKIAIVERRS
jgi:phage-related protein